MNIALDISKLEEILGVKAELFPDEGVAKASFPRTDVEVTIEGRPMESFMGLTSWVAFQKGTKPGVEAMLMGDLVLFEDEVNPIMTVLLDGGLEVTALHNHFFFERPRVFFMHIGGEGALTAIAGTVRDALKQVSAVRAKAKTPSDRFPGSAIPTDNRIDGARIQQTLGVAGTAKDGMYKVVIGRETKAGCGCKVGKNMGVNTWAAFAGEDENAFVDGDFAVLEHELGPVLRSLRGSGINVVAIHNHMVLEEPRFVFLHYWGKGTTMDLARGVRVALDKTTSTNVDGASCCKHE